MWEYNHTDELYHHGVKGMKWGVRRYQNEDGTLTDEGKKHYADLVVSSSKSVAASDALRDDYLANETPRMKEKRQELTKLWKEGGAVRKKLDRDLDNLESELIRRIDDGRLPSDSEWTKQYNAKMKEIKENAKQEFKRIEAEEKKLVREWTNEFLGKYAKQKVATVIRGKSVTIDVGKEFADMFTLATYYAK